MGEQIVVTTSVTGPPLPFFFFSTELGNSSLKENWQEGSDKYTTHNPQGLTWQAESHSQELHEPAWAVLQL